MDVRGKLIALAGIIISAFIIYLIVKYRNYNLSNPVLFENINQTKDIMTTNKNEKYKATVSLKNAEKSLQEAQRNNYSVQDIEDAKEAVRAAKSRIKMYMSKDGEKITNVPSLPMNLTYSLLLKFKIKNNSNAFDPYCIFFRGNDIDNGSPSLWFDPKTSGLIIIFKDLRSNDMEIDTRAIPLQRWNTLKIVIKNREIKLILNDMLFKVETLVNIPRLASCPIRLLPGESSEHIDVSYFRYFDHALELTRISKENFEQNEPKVYSVRNPYDNFYSKVYTELITNNIKKKTIFEIEDVIERTNMKSYNQIDLLDIGAGGGDHTLILEKKAFPNMDIIALDRSPFMLKELEDKKKTEDLRLIQGNALNPDLFQPLSFSHITCFYFTIYSIQADILAENVRKWLRNGGWFVVHLVDPKRFDPIIDAANPFYGLTLQKYSKKRITESSVKFKEFSYYSNFEMNDNDSKAYFNEEFHFNDSKKIRKQTHPMVMHFPDIIKKKFENKGLIHKFTTDLTNEGYFYQYLYYFQKGDVPDV